MPRFFRCYDCNITRSKEKGFSLTITAEQSNQDLARVIEMYKTDITFNNDSGVYITTKRQNNEETIQVGCNLKIDLQSMAINRNKYYGLFMSSLALQYVRIIGCEISRNEFSNVHLINIHNYQDRKYGVSIRDSELDSSRQGCGIYSKDTGLLLVNCTVRANFLGIHVLA